MQAIYRKYIATVTVIWTAALILFVLGYMFILIPKDKEVQSQREALNAKEFELKRAIDADSNESRTKLAEEFGNLSERAANYVLSIEAASKLAFDIGQIASELEVKEFSCSVNNNYNDMLNIIPDCKSISVMYLGVNFNSSFNKLAQFINRLERSRPAIFVDKFDIAYAADDNNEHKIGLALKVFVSNISIQAAKPVVEVVSGK
ncbi:MAG: hypothetical protein A2178_01270 [Planctomycetes bacterium GWC2_49_10]|nr:MAG: hypothetical protein A2178_01270 [Planctomycetes bacterium GWC2_49_10]